MVTPVDTFATFATPEHIAFRYRLAGPLARGLAYGIDWFIRLTLIVVGFLLTMLIFGPWLEDAAFGMWLLFLFVLDWFYGALFEWLWKGYTPGKRSVGIRVVDSDGLPAGVAACFLRNLLRTADGLPFLPLMGPMAAFPTFGIGLMAMVFGNRRFQRLGDLAAGTLVVYVEQSKAQKIPRFTDEKLMRRVDDLPVGIERALAPSTQRALSSFVLRRRRMSIGRREEIAAHLAKPLRQHFSLDGSWGHDELLCAFYVRCFQGQEGEGAGAGAQALAVLRERTPEWRRLEELAEAGPVVSYKNPSNKQKKEVDSQRGDPRQFAAMYRSTCADLAIAESYQLPDQQVHYLHDLISRVHLAFYRRIQFDFAAVWYKMWVEVPGRLYSDGCLRMAMIAFFGVFGACAVLGWYDPALVEQYLGEDHVGSLREMYADPVNDREVDQGAYMSGFYIFNNVGISLACFASGIFLGIGSLIYLVFNGVVLGLSFGYMASSDVDGATRSHFFEFVTAHGPFELFGIALSGAAGMRLGLGLVTRDGGSRLDGLKRSARQAFPILAVAALFVACAAPIEGFISPSSLSLSAKRSVAILCGVAILVYLSVLGAVGQRRLSVREDGRP